MSARPSRHVMINAVLVMLEAENHTEETTKLHDRLVKEAAVESMSFKWEVSKRNAAFRPGIKMVNVEFQVLHGHLIDVQKILGELDTVPTLPQAADI